MNPPHLTVSPRMPPVRPDFRANGMKALITVSIVSLGMGCSGTENGSTEFITALTRIKRSGCPKKGNMYGLLTLTTDHPGYLFRKILVKAWPASVAKCEVSF